MRPTFSSSGAALRGSCLGGLFLLAACGGGDATHEITDVETVRTDLELGVPADQRHGFRRMDSSSATMGGATRLPLAWDTPEGWMPGPTNAFRVASFMTEGGADISLTALPGGAGGALANINRWREQMGQGPLPDLNSLDKRTVLGTESHVVDVKGTYTGGGTPVTDARMLGLVVPGQSHAVFVKMVGPAADIDAQQAAFFDFADSLRLSGGVHDDGGNPQAGDAISPPPPDTTQPAAPTSQPSAEVAGPASAGKLKWVVPAGWTLAADKPMRMVNYHPGGNAKVEAYIVVLPGDAGGLQANLDRWNQQAGLPPLSAEQRAALPKIPVNGADAVVLDAFGDSEGVVGVVASLGDDSLFLKMVGPTDDVRGARESFLEFARSVALK